MACFDALGVILSRRPAVVQITRRFVCPPGAKMIVRRAVFTCHRPEQRAIETYCQEVDGSLRSVEARSLVVLWFMFFIVSIPVSIFLVWLERLFLA